MNIEKFIKTEAGDSAEYAKCLRSCYEDYKDKDLEELQSIKETAKTLYRTKGVLHSIVASAMISSELIKER